MYKIYNNNYIKSLIFKCNTRKELQKIIEDIKQKKYSCIDIDYITIEED